MSGSKNNKISNEQNLANNISPYYYNITNPAKYT